jgi:hypothetical protein
MFDYKFTLNPFSTEHRIPANELSPVRLPLALVFLPNQISHRDSRKRRGRGRCRLLSLILPDRIARRIFPSIPPISIDDTSGSRAAHHLDTFNVLPVHHVSSGDKRTYVLVPCLQLLLTVTGGQAV